MRFLDGAPVVVPPVSGSEEAAAAQAGHGQAMRVDGFHSLLQTHLRDLIAPGRDAADAVAHAALNHLREVPLLVHRRGVERELHFSSSGAISLGRIRGISGQMMIAASISSMGTSMIIVSLSANLSGTLATAHEIMRHRP